MSSTLFDNPETKMPSTELATVEVTPLTLIQSALQQGLDVRELVTLEREIREDAAKQAYAVAMVAAQREMPVVAHDAVNTHTRSGYTRLEKIQKITKPIYSRFGFAMSFGEDDCPLPNHKRTICDVTHEGGHMRNYHLDLPIDGSGAKGGTTSMNAVQGCISTTSYGQRRLCCMIWNITISGEDDDAQTFSHIDETHITTLKEWIESTNTNQTNFLRWLGVETLVEMTTDQYSKALTELKRKAAKK